MVELIGVPAHNYENLLHDNETESQILINFRTIFTSIVNKSVAFTGPAARFQNFPGGGDRPDPCRVSASALPLPHLPRALGWTL